MISNLVAWFRRKREERMAAVMFERQVIVRFDEEGISAAYPDGKSRPLHGPPLSALRLKRMIVDLGVRTSGGFLKEKELVALTRKARQAILKPWQNTQRDFPDSATLRSSKQWGARQMLDLRAGSEAMRSNKRIEFARFACPTRKGEAPLLAVHSRR